MQSRPSRQTNRRIIRRRLQALRHAAALHIDEIRGARTDAVLRDVYGAAPHHGELLRAGHYRYGYVGADRLAHGEAEGVDAGRGYEEEDSGRGCDVEARDW